MAPSCAKELHLVGAFSSWLEQQALVCSGPDPRLRLWAAVLAPRSWGLPSTQSETGPPGYTLRIEASAIEIAPKRIVSAITYNGQFPGPLLRFKEGQDETVDVHNDSRDTPEQLHWHGQMVSTWKWMAQPERGYIAFYPGGTACARITSTPRPAGFRFYHHAQSAGAPIFSAGQYTRPGWSGLHRAEA